MKDTLVSIFLLLLLTSTPYLPNAFAQDYTKWSLPEGAKARLGKGSISEIAYSPDGRRLAVASSIGIWIYNAATGEEIDLLTGHTSSVESVSFSSDGQTLASGSWDNTVRVWDVNTGKHLRTLEGHTLWVNSVSFSPDGNTLASGSADETVRVWDVNTGRHLRTLTGDLDRIHSVSFSSDGQTLASGSWDNTVRVWDINTGRPLHTLRHTDRVHSVAFSPDGNTLASGGDDDTVRVWDANTGKHLHTLRHTDWVNSVSFSPDGQTLASGSWDNTVNVWDVNTGRHLRTLTRRHTGYYYYVYSVAFSPDGNTLASGSGKGGGEIHLWDVNTGRSLRTVTLTGHMDRVNSVSFSPDDSILASGGSSDDNLHLWDVNTGRHLRTLEGHTYWVDSVSFSPDGQLLASGSQDGTPRVWDVNTGSYLRTLTGRGSYGNSVAFSPDGNTLASAGAYWNENHGSSNYIVGLWDVNTNRQIGTLEGHQDRINSVSFSPDGNTLASGSADETVRVWDVNTGRHLRTLTGHGSLVASVSFSPDGNTLASASGGGLVRLWDANTGKHLHSLRHTNWVDSVAFSPDGSILASGSSDDNLRVWDVNTGRHLRTLTGHTSSVTSVSFSPDGSILASGSSDGTVLLWEEIETLFITVKLSPAKVASPMIGKQLTFSLNITNGENVTGYQATLKYDTSALRYVDSANGDYLPRGAFFVPPVVSWNKVTLGATSLAGVSNGDGTLATVTFEVVDVKKSIIAIDETILTDSEGEHLSHLAYGTKVVEPSLLPTDAIISLTPSSVLSPAIGERLTFNIDITGGQNVKDVALTLDFDQSALKHISSHSGEYLANGVGNEDGILERVTFEVLAVKASTVSVSGHLVAPNGLLYLPNFESAEVILPLFGDVNRDGVVNILDLVQVASSFGQPVPEEGNPADVNEDGVVNIVDLVKVAGALGSDAAAPSSWSLSMDGTLTRDQVQKWLSEARRFTFTDATSQRGILFLEQLLAALTPKETALLPNYPNPFNPETWIPYQLSEDSQVSVSIYDTTGQLIRTLSLGFQSAGFYNSRGRAAYWNGRNELGESVASGLYFYTLTAGDFTATRKLLIRK